MLTNNQSGVSRHELFHRQLGEARRTPEVVKRRVDLLRRRCPTDYCGVIAVSVVADQESESKRRY